MPSLSQLLNPAVVQKQPDSQSMSQGCGSFPGIHYLQKQVAGWISMLTFVLEKYVKTEKTLMVYCYRNKIIPNKINMILTLFFKDGREFCQQWISLCGRFKYDHYFLYYTFFVF